MPNAFCTSIFYVDKLSSKPSNPLSANLTKCSNTLKKFVSNFPTNCLSVFDHFVWLALKGLKSYQLKKKDMINRTNCSESRLIVYNNTVMSLTGIQLVSHEIPFQQFIFLDYWQ